MTTVGVLREVKNQEYRVALTPAGAEELCRRKHRVVVEAGAGVGAGFEDEEYTAAGGEVLPSADAVFRSASLLLKVKEPLARERQKLRPHHTLFTFLHLAPDPEQTDDLLASGATCIAYETVTNGRGQLPLLTPMSEVAGRLAVQAGARALERPQGGRGVLLGGVPGTEPGQVLVIGGGTVGRQAIRMALGLGARVTVLDKSIAVLRDIDGAFEGRVVTRFSTEQALAELLAASDLVIGAVLVPGATAPKLIRRNHLAGMRPGSVIVDVAIDQGGCAETSRPTTHDSPTYVVDGVVHYCVANMPGAVARTSTLALTQATLPYVMALADKGPVAALRDDPGLGEGLNVARGALARKEIADAQSREFTRPEILLEQLEAEG